jgi:hypothetical protein
MHVHTLHEHAPLLGDLTCCIGTFFSWPLSSSLHRTASAKTLGSVATMVCGRAESEVRGDAQPEWLWTQCEWVIATAC